MSKREWNCQRRSGVYDCIYGFCTVAVLLCSLSMAGCVRREGRNADCRWPGETPRHAAEPRHLSADAEFAEDLAIRYADTHHGLRTPNYESGAIYGAERDRCMGTLFAQIAKEHGVPVGRVYGALGQNRASLDFALNFPFMLLSCLATIAVVRVVWSKYPPAEHGWVPGATMVLFLSLVMAFAILMLGEVSSWILETYRVGNSHMSYRVQRLWWDQHRGGIFAGSVAVFWAAAAARARVFLSHHV